MKELLIVNWTTGSFDWIPITNRLIFDNPFTKEELLKDGQLVELTWVSDRDGLPPADSLVIVKHCVTKKKSTVLLCLTEHHTDLMRGK